MPTTRGHYSACGLAMLAVLAFTGRQVDGSPLDDTSITGPVFTGPAHPHPSAVFINPAALDIATSGSHFYLGGYVGLDRVVIDRLIIRDPDVGLEAGEKVKELLPRPGGMFAFHQKLEQLSIGVSVAIPLLERFPESEALRYHASRGHHLQIAPLSVAVALRPFKRVHVGVGLSMVLSSFEMTFARDTALAGGEAGIRETNCGGSCGIENAQAAQTIKVDVATNGLQPFSVFNIFDFFSLDNFNLNVGMIVRLRPGWFAGLSYRAPPRFSSETELVGKVTVVDSPRDGGATREGKAEVAFKPNQSVLLGVRGPVLDRFELILGVQFHNLSRHNELDIRLFGQDLAEVDVPNWIPRYRGFKDVWRFEAGLESRSAGRVRYGARLRFETAAVTNSRMTPIQVEGTNLGIALGSEVRFGGGWSLGGSYLLTWYPSTDATDNVFDPQSLINCVDSEFELSSCGAVRQGRALPTAAGKYSRILQGFSAWIRYDNL